MINSFHQYENLYFEVIINLFLNLFLKVSNAKSRLIKSKSKSILIMIENSNNLFSKF